MKRNKPFPFPPLPLFLSLDFLENMVYIAQASPNCAILLPQPPEYQDYS